jgi:hypothetical protein
MTEEFSKSVLSVDVQGRPEFTIEGAGRALRDDRARLWLEELQDQEDISGALLHPSVTGHRGDRLNREFR